MKNNYENVINELKKIYLNSSFEIKEENGAIKLLCDNRKLAEEESYLDKVCELALEYLTQKERNVFCCLYDFFDEMTIVADRIYPNSIKKGYEYDLCKYSKLDIFESREDMEAIAA